MRKIIFELNSKEDKFVEDCYKKAMKELSEFFEINWVRNTPNIILLKNRKEIDQIKGGKQKIG